MRVRVLVSSCKLREGTTATAGAQQDALPDQGTGQVCTASAVRPPLSLFVLEWSANRRAHPRRLATRRSAALRKSAWRAISTIITRARKFHTGPSGRVVGRRIRLHGTVAGKNS